MIAFKKIIKLIISSLFFLQNKLEVRSFLLVLAFLLHGLFLYVVIQPIIQQYHHRRRHYNKYIKYIFWIQREKMLQ